MIEAHGAPVRIGADCVVRENLNIRSTNRNAVEIGDHVLIGPLSSLKGCTIEDECFLATGVKVHQGRGDWPVHGGSHRRRGPRA